MSTTAIVREPYLPGAAGGRGAPSRHEAAPPGGPGSTPPGGADAMPPGGGGRDPFMPRPPAGRGRALALALAAHVLLILALAFGVAWHDDTPTTVAAELWSATPQAVAPRLTEVAPPVPTVPRVAPRPVERPVVKPPEAVQPKPPPLPDAQIAIEQARREQARRDAAAEQARDAKARREREATLEQQRRNADAAARERQAAQAKAARDAEQRKSELARLQQEKIDKAEKAAEAQKTAQAKADAARAAAAREANLKRLAGLAGATGGPTDSGSAQRSSGPSPGYAGRVAARVKPNIVFADAVEGNPTAVVQVRLGADGTIIAKRLIQSSGIKAWDEAVLRAIERTEMLPLDNGRAPPQFEIGFRPKD